MMWNGMCEQPRCAGHGPAWASGRVSRLPPPQGSVFGWIRSDPARNWNFRTGSGTRAAPTRRTCKKSRQIAPKLHQVAQTFVRHPPYSAFPQNRRTGSATRYRLKSPHPPHARHVTT